MGFVGGHQCHKTGRGIGPGDVAVDGNHILGETPVQQGREQPSATSHYLEGRGGEGRGGEGGGGFMSNFPLHQLQAHSQGLHSN